MDAVATPDGTEVTYYINPNFAIFTTFRPVIMEWAEGTGTRCGTLFG